MGEDTTEGVPDTSVPEIVVFPPVENEQVPQVVDFRIDESCGLGNSENLPSSTSNDAPVDENSESGKPVDQKSSTSVVESEDLAQANDEVSGKLDPEKTAFAEPSSST